ncbi:UNVERIFIED_ORG: hypothetical protein OKW15_003812 [Pseudomonas reinekei]|nr:hypothetical protein [Pseudomonas reinekei]
MGNNETSLGDFESTLKKHAVELVESLEKGKFGDAVQLIHELNQTRDRGLYQEVGKLTRELHSAIVNFQIDPHMPQAEEVSQITDATERLGYVVKLTEAAANRTMDLVESATPLVNSLADEAQALSTDWGRFMRREVGAEEFRELARRVDGLPGAQRHGQSRGVGQPQRHPARPGLPGPHGASDQACDPTGHRS